jgi:lipoprotein-releasing system ATP-binding protein
VAESTPDYALELHEVRKSYGGGKAPLVEVLHGISLQLVAGSFSALIGPSGSGKSTMLNIMGLLERPTSGEIVIAGESTSGRDEAALTALRNQHIGFIFQFHHLLPAFNAVENVLMPMFAGAGKLTPAMRERAMHLLDRVGLADHAHQKPVELSGGQQQRVAIVRALAGRPRLVLADEPTGNLDTHSADDAFALMREINREDGVTFLIVTHDPRLAARADSRLNLVDGQLAAEGT